VDREAGLGEGTERGKRPREFQMPQKEDFVEKKGNPFLRQCVSQLKPLGAHLEEKWPKKGERQERPEPKAYSAGRNQDWG